MTEFPMTRVTLSTEIALNAVDIGPRDAPVLIFLHGFPESHRTWRHQLREFSKDFRCIAPDQRGYRHSDKPDGVPSYTPDKIIADVFALADALGVGNFTVVGHDWGGAMAWGVALGGQGRVERCIILNAPHPFLFQNAVIDDPDQRAASQYITAFRDPANDALIGEHGLVGLLAKVVKWNRSPALEDAERDAMLADWKIPGAAMAMINWYRAAQIQVPTIGEDAVRPAFLDAPFPKVTMPTLVIWAMDDLALRPSLIDGLDALVDDLTLVEVYDCGHFVTWEKPDAVNAAMRAFLAR
ncbi:MAG: alpha/beta fold hydrolase [Sphingomonadaceae bacterium]